MCACRSHKGDGFDFVTAQVTEGRRNRASTLSYAIALPGGGHVCAAITCFICDSPAPPGEGKNEMPQPSVGMCGRPDVGQPVPPSRPPKPPPSVAVFTAPNRYSKDRFGRDGSGLRKRSPGPTPVQLIMEALQRCDWCFKP